MTQWQFVQQMLARTGGSIRCNHPRRWPNRWVRQHL